MFINRCAKVVKGGRRFSFSALIVAGDHDGKVGVGFGKANEVAESDPQGVRSGAQIAWRKCLLHENVPSPHETIGEFGGGRVLLRPASPGTGVIAGGGVRAVVEAVGIRDVLAKSLGSSNHANVVKATIEALRGLRRKDEIFKTRGIRPANYSTTERSSSFVIRSAQYKAAAAGAKQLASSGHGSWRKLRPRQEPAAAAATRVRKRVPAAAIRLGFEGRADAAHPSFAGSAGSGQRRLPQELRDHQSRCLERSLMPGKVINEEMLRESKLIRGNVVGLKVLGTGEWKA